MDKVEQFHLVHRFYRDMWNSFDTSVFPDLLEEDILFRGSLGTETKGYDELKAYVNQIQSAFPDFNNEVLDAVSEGSRTFVRMLYTGTHRGEILGIAPTGKKISYQGAALFSFGLNKIKDIWVLGDLHGLIRQLED